MKTIRVKLVTANGDTVTREDGSQLTFIMVSEAELRGYINFVDNIRSHAPSVEMKIKYDVYKEILGEE